MRKSTNIIALCVFCLIVLACNNTKKSRNNTSNISTEEQEADSGMLEIGAEFLQQVEAYEAPERRNWQNPELVLNQLKPVENMTIADIGAGTGYFTFPLAEDSTLKVIAVDIDDRFLNFIEDRKLDYPNGIAQKVETRITSENDPSLQEGEIDKALMVNVYAYISERVSYMKKVRVGLRTGGEILLVDFKPGNLPVGPGEEAKIGMETVQKELEEAGFEIQRADNTSLEYQYMILATKK